MNCPHCKELIGIASKDIRVIEKEEEIPLYLGNCCDCKFADSLSKKEMENINQGCTNDEDKIVAMCAIQGNMNTIMFTKKQFKEKINYYAEGFRIKVKNHNEPHCFAFKKRDKKIDIDKL